MPEIKNGGIVITEPQEKEVFPVGIEGKQIKEIADKAIEDSGAANEVPLATQSDSGKIIKVDAEGKYVLADESTGTNVVANPELAGTEADLTGLQVGDTKYKIAAGGGGSDSFVVLTQTLPTYPGASNTIEDVLVEAGFNLENPPQYGGETKWVFTETDGLFSISTAYADSAFVNATARLSDRTMVYDSLDSKTPTTTVFQKISSSYASSNTKFVLIGHSNNPFTVEQLYDSQLVPSIDALDGTKTYVLKCVNGTLEWVEENA